MKSENGLRLLRVFNKRNQEKAGSLQSNNDRSTDNFTIDFAEWHLRYGGDCNGSFTEISPGNSS